MAANDDTLPITFAVSGTSGPPLASRGATPSAAALPGHVKASVQVATQRDAGTPQRLTAVPGEDIVALHIEGGPVLLLHPGTARDLLQGPGGRQRDGGDVAVAAELAWPGPDTSAAQRGLGDIGHIVVSALQVLTGLVKDPAADFAASQVVQRVDAQVDAGVYRLAPDALPRLKGSGHKLDQVPTSADPILVLLHGTFVETTSTFGQLWQGHASGVGQLFAQYAGQVYALDHPTLGASPIANARTLVDALPDGARLHLVTHSRGGLVAEVLARVAGPSGVTDDDLAFFADPAYASQQQELRELAALVRSKGVRVERVVRVACPARGTLLASGRLDAYLSVLKWTLEIAGVPVVPAFVDFLGEVARRRADPMLIPGLAAMIPGTPLVDWLNAAPDPLPGDLRVVAGDLQHGDTLGSWLKALLADAYYWTDNDIVVQTRSMYGGGPRAGGATFLLAQGSDVTHFGYFANDQTADAVVQALIQPLPPAGFRPIGPLSWAGEDASGARGAVRSVPDATRPAVFVLPGILGSNLKQGQPPHDDRIWLSPRLIGNFARLAYQPGGADEVADDGPIGLVYDKLVAFLDASHEVIPFGYDWRRPLEDEAARLAARVRQALDARQASGQPVRLLAHSMGGLLARTMQLVEPETWRRLMAHPDARLLMLGTPNGGSWAPMQVLSGDDTFGNALAALGSPFANRKARNLMAAMPGLLQLQAGLLDARLGLDQEPVWRKLADDDYQREQQKNWWHRYAEEMMGAAYAWGVPPQAVLDQARALRQRLDAQLAGALATDADKLMLVVGHAKFTPDGFEVGDDGFVYLDAQDGGDGRVALESALLPGVRTWTLDCEHGSLPSATQAFDAYAELLRQGSTTALAPLAAARGEAAPVAHVRSRPSRGAPSALPAGGIAEVFGASSGGLEGPAAAAPPPLDVSLLNGNLTFVSQPLMLGHYRALELTGTEGVVDKHLGGAMRTALEAGLYPDAPGSHQVFLNTQHRRDNPWQLPRPRAVIVIGLGEEGSLDAARLQDSVCQGVKAWAQRAAEDAGGLAIPGRSGIASPEDGGLELAATLIGSGGIGISPGTAARAIAQGVRQANQRLAAIGWPLVRRLTLVEWYLDRAGEAWHGLQVLAAAAPLAFRIAPAIASGTGPLRYQPEIGYRGASYDLISTTTSAEGTISFALDTRRARTEVRAQHTQTRLLEQLVARAATARTSDPDLGRTLFQLLVPLELEPFLGGTNRVVLQLDDGTAPIPWELLDTSAPRGGEAAASEEPWAIRTRLLRKLNTTTFRSAPRDADADAAVLVIGAPKVDDPDYPDLPGARDEAQAVAGLLGAPDALGGQRVTALLDSAEFDAVIGALMARPWRIVHVAGHGAPIVRDDKGHVTSFGGVVLSQGVFLGPDEIAKLPVVPELVFVNCCHLGAHDSQETLKLAQPGAFAAGVADALIQIGVRCVIAAGWAVDDRPAELFAATFYRWLLAGQTFIDAVAEARRSALRAAPGSKTWAAYQCYGDPNWTLRRATGDAQGPAESPDATRELASAPGLALTLEELAVRTRFEVPDSADAEATRVLREAAQRKLQALQNRYAAAWGSMGAVAEAFAVAWDAVGDRDAAIDWYARAVRAADGSASLRAQEQLGNLRVRRAWTQVQQAPADAATRDAARGEITLALRELQTLASLQPTVERLSLCGSGWKRLAQLEGLAGRAGRRAENAALAMALQAYTLAEALSFENGDALAFYPGLNRMAIEFALHGASPAWPGFDAAATARLQQCLQDRHASDPDFWTSAGLIELELYAALAAHALSARQPALAAAWGGLHARVQACSWWASVADQASFVCGRLGPRAGPAQRRAADALVAQLRGYAA